MKVGLEFIKQVHVQKKLEEYHESIDLRMKANKIYNLMFVIQES